MKRQKGQTRVKERGAERKRPDRCGKKDGGGLQIAAEKSTDPKISEKLK